MRLKDVPDKIVNHPKSTAAAVLGTAAAAGIWWVLRKPERVAALRKQLAQRASAWRSSRGH